MACRFGPGVEVLMEPAAAGTIDAAGFPLHFNDLIVAPAREGMRAQFLRPEQDIAGGLQSQQDRASAVIMRLVIARRRPGGEVADQAVAGYFELSDADAGAFDFALIDVGGLNITNEIGLPDMLHAGLVAFKSLFEITVVGGVTI